MKKTLRIFYKKCEDLKQNLLKEYYEDAQMIDNDEDLGECEGDEKEEFLQ